MLAELDRQEPGRIGAQCDRQHALVRGSLDSRNVDGDLARAAGLAREPRAVLRGAGALEHVQLVFTRWAKRVCALAHDHAARRAGELAATIVSERSAAFQQAVQKDFAFAQGDGEVIHLYQTAESAERSGRDHPPKMDSCTSKVRCTRRTGRATMGQPQGGFHVTHADQHRSFHLCRHGARRLQREGAASGSRGDTWLQQRHAAASRVRANGESGRVGAHRQLRRRHSREGGNPFFLKKKNGTPAFAGATFSGVPKAGLLYFFSMLWSVLTLLIEIDRAQMNTYRNPAQTGRQAPGVVARALRTPRTLAFPGLAR